MFAENVELLSRAAMLWDAGREMDYVWLESSYSAASPFQLSFAVRQHMATKAKEEAKVEKWLTSRNSTKPNKTKTKGNSLGFRKGKRPMWFKKKDQIRRQQKQDK